MSKMKPGDKFGRLTLIEKVVGTSTYSYKWKCRCDCGNEIVAVQCNIRTGNTSSCGCFRVERLRRSVSTHGKSNSAAYRAWCGMIQRCTNRRNMAFENYGGRGISVDPEWYDFTKFHHDMGDPPRGGTIERKDVNGNYEKSNCTWANRSVQAKNKRNNVNFTYKGKTLCLKEWANEMGVNYWTYHARFRRGWEIERIIETPIGKK